MRMLVINNGMVASTQRTNRVCDTTKGLYSLSLRLISYSILYLNSVFSYFNPVFHQLLSAVSVLKSSYSTSKSFLHRFCTQLYFSTHCISPHAAYHICCLFSRRLGVHAGSRACAFVYSADGFNWIAGMLRLVERGGLK